MYLKKLSENLIIRNATLADAEGMAVLQRRVFTSLSAAELMSAEHFTSHIKIFNAGQFVVEYAGQIIGSTSTFRCKYPPSVHSFLEITADRTIKKHDADGDWLYGIDTAVDSRLHGLGLGRYLYIARSELCRELGLSGQVTVGMPSGYGAFKDKVTFEEYYQKVLSGVLFDPTVSMQMRIGFEPQNYIADYLTDPKCGNYGVLMRLNSNQNINAAKCDVNDLLSSIKERY